MTQYLTFVFSVAILAFPLQANEDVKKRALSFANVLKKTLNVNREFYAFPKRAAPNAEVEAGERAKKWHEMFFVGQEKFKILDVKVSGNYASAIVGSKNVGSPFDGLAHPICLVKQEGSWNIAPMISNFTFAEKPLDGTADEAIELLQRWIDGNMGEIHQHQVSLDKKAFKEAVKAKSLKLRKSCKTSKDLAIFFMKQVKLRSVEGICAATGYDMDARSGTHRHSPLLLESVIKALHPQGANIGAWKILLNDTAVSQVVKVLKDGKTQGDSVAVALVHPEIENLYQVAMLRCFINKDRHWIRLPFELMGQKVGEKLKFADTGFEKFNLKQKLQHVWDDIPELLLHSYQSNYSPTIDRHIRKLEKAKEAKDFKTWFACHMPLGGIKGDKAKDYLKRICINFNIPHKESREYTLVKVETSKDGKSAAALKLKIDYVNTKASQSRIVGFKKYKNGWGIFPNVSDIEIKKLSAKFGKTNSEVIKTFFDGVKKQIIVLDLASLVPTKIADSKVLDDAKSFFNALRRSDLIGAADRGCEVRKNKLNSAEKLSFMLEEYVTCDKVKVVKVMSSSLGVAAVLVNRKKGKSDRFVMHFMVNSPDGMKMDVANNLGLATDREVAIRLNRLKFNRLNAHYSKSMVDFFKSSHDSMAKLVKKMETSPR